MSTYVGSAEAARMLGVTPATLYAYVSRGRIGRRAGPDGRTSLFAVDDVAALAARSRRAPTGPRPTIDVRITSEITRLDESGVSLRGHDLAELARTHRFEDVAHLLWTGAGAEGTVWGPTDPVSRSIVETIRDGPELSPIASLSVATLHLDDAFPTDSASEAAQRLIRCAPELLGSTRRTGPIAARLAAAWRRRPTAELVSAVDTSLLLLADHELATSTLAVRVAASVRCTPYAAFCAGLSAVSGVLHGSASHQAHEFLLECESTSPEDVLRGFRRTGRRLPGFGHKVYRGVDPRYALLLAAVRSAAGTAPMGRVRLELFDRTVAEAGRLFSHQPNIDLALAALTWTMDLPADVPIFAVARIAGWAAHYAEECDAPPVRYRAVAG